MYSSPINTLPSYPAFSQKFNLSTRSNTSKRGSWTLPRFTGNQDRDYTDLFLKSARNHASQRTYSLALGRSKPDPHLVDTLDHFLEPNDIVLEIGCNEGNNLLALGKKYNVYGLDLAKNCVDRLNSSAETQGLKDRVHAAQWDIAEDGTLPPEWPDLRGQCKAIYAVHTLSHFSEKGLKDLVQKVKPYLAPGGIFVVTILDPETPAKKDSNSIKWLMSFCKRMYDLSDLNAGFVSHTQSTVDEAFKEFKLIKEYSRPFKANELVQFVLPENRLRWAVYQVKDDLSPSSKPAPTIH